MRATSLAANACGCNSSIQ